VLVHLISTEDLAIQLGYSTATSAFREWCVKLRIMPVPGRRGFYDPALVRRRLDEAQGLIGESQSGTERELTPIESRRARRGKS